MVSTLQRFHCGFLKDTLSSTKDTSAHTSTSKLGTLEQKHFLNVPKFSTWNIICFRQKRSFNVQFFRLLSAPNSSCHFIEATRLGFNQFLHHCSLSWKITLQYFFSSNVIYFAQKEPIEVKLSDFWVVRLGEN